MSDKRKPASTPPMSAWSLEPVEGEAPAAKAPQGAAAKPAKFHANTRDGGDRRANGERREMLRFQDDRRAGKDRRPRKSWEPGSNL